MTHNSLILTILAASFSVLSVIGGLMGICGTAWYVYDYRKELRIQKHFYKPAPIRDGMMADARKNIVVWASWTIALWIIAVCMDIYVV